MALNEITGKNKNLRTGTTNREVIYSMKHLIADKGPISDETSFSNRELYYLLLRYRSRVLSQKKRERGFSLSRHNIQTITCIPIDSIDLDQCPCTPDSGCTFNKTRYKLPKTISNLQSVTSVDGSIQYDYLQWERFPDLKNSRFKAERTKPYYTLKNVGDGTYLYLYNDQHKEFVSVTGTFENPLEVQNFPSCEKGSVNSCFKPMDQEFIIDPDLLPLIYDLAFAQLFRVKQVAIDNLNDDVDNITNSSTAVK